MPEPSLATNNLTPYHTSGREFQILSLDGGGIRGLYTATLLASLEQDLGTHLLDHFDLLAGTSTGGIIALGLTLGKSPDELARFYREDGPRIFPRGQWFGARARHLLRAKYNADVLERALRREFEEEQLADCSRALVITTYNLDDDAPKVLKTPHHRDLRRDHTIPAWQAALATSAAPTFLRACPYIGKVRLVDGGVWANNPALVAAIEAHRYLGVPFEAMRILSIGTGTVLHRRSRWLSGGGCLAWLLGGRDVPLRAQGESVENQTNLLVGKDRVHRINPTVTGTWSRMDVIRCEYEARALADAQAHGAEIADNFMGHRALDLHQLRTMTRNTQEVEKHAQI